MQTTQRTGRPLKFVGDVCLYGTPAIGFHYLARASATGPLIEGGLRDREGHGGTFGTTTEAIWHACDAIRAAGTTRGAIVIHAPGGTMHAVTFLHAHVPNAGSLEWVST